MNDRINELQEQIDMTKAVMSTCQSDEAYRIYSSRLDSLIYELVELKAKESNNK